MVFLCILESGDIADYLGNYNISLDLLPNKTSSVVKQMSQETDIEAAYNLANKITENNAYVTHAYKVKVDYAFTQGNWEEMCENQKKLIMLRRYDINQYEELVFMISKALDITIKKRKTR